MIKGLLPLHAGRSIENKLIDMSLHYDIINMERQLMRIAKKTTGEFALIPLEALQQAAECLKTLAHPHRLRMVQMLLNGRYTVGELAEACAIPSHMTSEHLRLMQRCGLLSSRKDGRKTYYEIAEPHLKDIMDCIEARFSE
jgi:ArsR family transcriptional regulator, zinc-responsive transcriptional repressor